MSSEEEGSGGTSGQGLIKGGATKAVTPGPPHRGPPHRGQLGLVFRARTGRGPVGAVI